LHIAAAIAEDASSPPPHYAASSPPPRSAASALPPALEGADGISDSDALMIFNAQFPNAGDFSIDEIKQFLSFNY
jgi:hypothetical protein